MNITKACNNYFHGFQDAFEKKSDPKTRAMGSLKIFSYFTGVIPLGFACTLGAAHLYKNIHKKEQLSPQEKRVNNQSNKTLVVQQPKATVQGKQQPKTHIQDLLRLQEEAKEAAKGEMWHTGPGGVRYHKLHEMIDNATLEQMPYIVKGAGTNVLHVLLNHKDEFALSPKVIEEIEEVLKLEDDLREATKSLPPFIWE